MSPDLVLLMFVFAVIYATLALRSYRRAKEIRVVHCPATGSAEAIRLHATGEALSLGLRAKPRVMACSLWPDRKGCAQGCLAEVKSSPEHCAMQLVLMRWYLGKPCAFCHQEIPPIGWAEPRPSLLSPDGRIVGWSDIKPTSLYDVLATHRAICARCDEAETFRRRFPDLFIERPPWPPESRPHA